MLNADELKVIKDRLKVEIFDMQKEQEGYDRKIRDIEKIKLEKIAELARHEGMSPTK